MMRRPQCFVLVPFGSKQDVSGRQIDFDAVYRDLFARAIESSGLDPIRPESELLGGLLEASVLKDLVTSEYAVADVSLPNPNVFYELGVRHALRPRTTVLVAADVRRSYFDLSLSQVLTYSVDSSGKPDDLKFPLRLAEKLTLASADRVDSPVYQFLPGLIAPDVSRSVSDTFRDPKAHEDFRNRLSKARSSGASSLYLLEEELGDLNYIEPAITVDLFLSYRSVMDWNRMVSLVSRMPTSLRETPLVQQQLALALNRTGNPEQAIRVAEALLGRQGPSSETYGILGRVYKDEWQRAVQSGNSAAEELLVKAIDAYVKGFESDWRDPYPGINALTLMELRDIPDERQSRLLPVVLYAIDRRIETSRADYWDYVTQLELAVLARDEKLAMSALQQVLSSKSESWQAATSARNIALIRARRERRG